MRVSSWFVRNLLVCLSILLVSPAFAGSIPGKFYEYYIVAATGGAEGFTALDQKPSINDNGVVGFMGQYGGGSTLWVGSGLGPPLNISPGWFNPGQVLFQGGVHINNDKYVLAVDRILTFPTAYDLRVWDGTTTDSWTRIVRGGLSVDPYVSIINNPAINNGGDSVFAAMRMDGPNSTAQYYLVSVLANGTRTELVIPKYAPMPAISDNGSIVARIGVPPKTQIKLYGPGLTNPQTIADSSEFSSLDNAPGISRDGNVMVFIGTLNDTGAANHKINAGPGVFAYTTGGSQVRVTGRRYEVLNTGGNNDLICDPGETCRDFAELGFDATGNPITFASYPADTRVSVSNLDLGAAGLTNDSFVVAFEATPSSASRSNPMLNPTMPLLFSGQKGLWTVRVDVENELAGYKLRKYHPYCGIPVIQVGDRLQTPSQFHVISDISVGDQIGFAARNENGTIRTMRRGDHRVAFWASTAAGAQIIVRGNHTDSNQDGLLDFWKTSGIDMDQDGIADLNLAAMGADPDKRDLFLEIDWVAPQGGASYELHPGVTSPLPGTVRTSFVDMFANAPKLTGAMYGKKIDGSPPDDIVQGITLHIDAGPGNDSTGRPFSINMHNGPLEGGDIIGMPGSPNTPPDVVYMGADGSRTVGGVNSRSLYDIKNNFFGTHDKRARELVFHYAVLAQYQDFMDGSTGAPFTGVATAATPVQISGPGAAGAGAGHVLMMLTGAAAGQKREISSASGTTTNAQINIKATEPFNPAPSVGDSYTILGGYSGLSQVYFYPANDNNSVPGRDFLVTLDHFGRSGNLVATRCIQWRTIAHELGHTLGLRHGGVDHYEYKGTAYKSLMSYSYQLECVPPSAVQSYSDSTVTYDDWANLKHNGVDAMVHLGTTMGIGFGKGSEGVSENRPDMTIAEYEAQNGPLDTQLPSVQITSPGAGATVNTGTPLTVTVTATDNVAVASVVVTFDLDGDGTTDGAGETVQAVLTGTNTFTASFGNVSGGNGTRAIRVFVEDTSTNLAQATRNVTVGNPPFDLGVLITGHAKVNAGAAVTYMIKAVNNGPGAVPGSTVTYALPAGMTLVSATSTVGACSGASSLTCNLGTLAAGAGATITITANAPASGTLINTAVISGVGTDSVPANNSSTVTTNVTPVADLTIVKTCPAYVTAGGNVTFTIIAGNKGPSASSGVSITDTLPAGMTFVSAASTAGSCSGGATVTCAIGSLPMNGTATVTIVAKAPASGALTNTVAVSGAELDPVGANNSSSATFTIPKAVKMGTGFYSTIRGAYDAVTVSGSKIQAVTQEFAETLNLDLGKTVTFEGGYDTLFSGSSGVTILHGSLTISSGAVTITNFAIK
jgi:uncharacterized repeat protein (TIGR01451 family)